MRPDSTITDNTVTIVSNRRLSQTVSIIAFRSPAIAAQARPGNFVAIRTRARHEPLLRRPFSIHHVEGDRVEIMTKSVGFGTTLLAEAPAGTTLQVLGPLGNSFSIDASFDTALLVSGGIGTAPMRFLETALREAEKKVYHIVGGKTKEDLQTTGLTNCHLATEDGSAGFRGNAVELFRKNFSSFSDADSGSSRCRVFSCGPNPMLKALAALCKEKGIPCEASLESIMGCGIGICYGCTVELKNTAGNGTSTILLCQEGPVIDAEKLLF